jgi:hypothetical protein
MPHAVRPVEVVANRENDMAGLTIDAQDGPPVQFVLRTLGIPPVHGWLRRRSERAFLFRSKLILPGG